MPLRRAVWVGAFVATAFVAAGASGIARAQDASPETGDSTARAQLAQAAASTDLAPTTALPWNPPRPESGRRFWETVVQLPGRIVTLPLSAIGLGTRDYLLFAEANSVVPRVLAIL